MVIDMTGKQLTHLLKVRYAISKDKKKPVLQGIHFYSKGGKLYAEATDGIMLSKTCIDYPYKQNIAFIVSGLDLRPINKHIKATSRVRLDIDDTLLTVYVDNMNFKCELYYDNTYLDTDRLIATTDRTKKVNCIIDKNELLSELKSIKKSIGTNKDIMVSIVFSSDLKNVLLVVNQDNKQIIKKLNCKLDGSLVPISFNLKYLIASVNAFDNKSLNLVFITPKYPMVLGANNTDLIGLICPVRVSQATQDYLNTVACFKARY